MIVSHKHKLIYIAVPKTGSRSVWETLKAEYGARMVPPEIEGGDPTGYHDPATLDGYTTIANVRNPYSRMVSLWHMIKRKRSWKMDPWPEVCQSFDRFVKFVTTKEPPRKPWAFTTQAEFLRDVRVDHLLRLESLQEDFDKLPFLREPLVLPQKNKGTYGNDWTRFYTPRIAALVRQWAQEDFSRYGYPSTLPTRP